MRNLPLGRWVVIEPIAEDEVQVVSTHAAQGEAEQECQRRNRGLPRPRYSTCIALEPMAERMGRSPS
jgi:hypothetical protein